MLHEMFLLHALSAIVLLRKFVYTNKHNYKISRSENEY